jgi:acyl carrier protein
METKLKSLLAKQFGIVEDTITLDTDIINDLNADSLDLLELVMAIEQTFKVAISEDEYKDTHTVGKILELINQKQIASNK